MLDGGISHPSVDRGALFLSPCAELEYQGEFFIRYLAACCAFQKFVYPRGVDERKGCEFDEGEEDLIPKTALLVDNLPNTHGSCLSHYRWGLPNSRSPYPI